MQKKTDDTFREALKRSAKLEENLESSAHKYRVLTGDRPTGLLHIGHLFGSLQNRIRLQSMGIPTFIVIADYQVLTDHDTTKTIRDSVENLVIDYLAAGLDPSNEKTYIFPHSQIPELNQLLLPFMTLVSVGELERNPTVKEELKVQNIAQVNSAMFTYPIHQAADILFCKGNIVPVGKDQLPHLELTRSIARRFNKKYTSIFPEPTGLLSQSPAIMGLDGRQKMSKSLNNAILLAASPDETVNLIKKAKTDSIREIYYDELRRPELANLLRILALCLDSSPEQEAERLGNLGAKGLKDELAMALNEYLAPMRKKRQQLAKDRSFIYEVLQKGSIEAREIASKTLNETRSAMNMKYI